MELFLVKLGVNQSGSVLIVFLLVIVMGTAVFMAVTTAQSNRANRTPAASATPIAAKGKLTFREEFNGAAGAKPSSKTWTYDTGKWPEELETYTTDAANAHTDGKGHLVMTATNTGSGYNSARIHTQDSFAQAYGRIEARLKLPNAKGVLPAFWMLGSNFETVEWPACGEIDILEVPGDGKVHMSLHGKGDDDGVGITGQTSVNVTQWHIYGVNWTPAKISWTIDGRTVRTVTKAQAGSIWSFNNPEFIILSLAVGGWAGTPPASAKFPVNMLVDYVRAYSN